MIYIYVYVSYSAISLYILYFHVNQIHLLYVTNKLHMYVYAFIGFLEFSSWLNVIDDRRHNSVTDNEVTYIIREKTHTKTVSQLKGKHSVPTKEGKAVRERNRRWRWCAPLFPSLQRHFPFGQRRTGVAAGRRKTWLPL